MKKLFSLLMMSASLNLMAASYKVVETKGTGGFAMVKTVKAAKAKVPGLVAQSLEEVRKAAASLKVQTNGAPFLKTIENNNGMITFQTGYPVSKELKNLIGFDMIKLPSGKVAQVEYTGSYADTFGGYNAVIEWMNSNNKEATDSPIEFYLSNPASVSPPNQKVKILYPIK